jgi:hypothetical protein
MFGTTTTAFAATHSSTTATTNLVTGTVTAIPVNQKPVQVFLQTNLQFQDNVADQPFTVVILDQASGTRLLSQKETTGDNPGQVITVGKRQQKLLTSTAPSDWLVNIEANGQTLAFAPIAPGTDTATFSDTEGTMTTGSSSTSSATTVTGSVEVFNSNTNTFPVAISLKAAQAANQQLFVTITDQATGAQILHQREQTNALGVITDGNAVIDNVQGLTTIPNTWEVIVTDANGNKLATAPFKSTGFVTIATLDATN